MKWRKYFVIAYIFKCLKKLENSSKIFFSFRDNESVHVLLQWWLIEIPTIPPPPQKKTRSCQISDFFHVWCSGGLGLKGSIEKYVFLHFYFHPELRTHPERFQPPFEKKLIMYNVLNINKNCLPLLPDRRLLVRSNRTKLILFNPDKYKFTLKCFSLSYT